MYTESITKPTAASNTSLSLFLNLKKPTLRYVLASTPNSFASRSFDNTQLNMFLLMPSATPRKCPPTNAILSSSVSKSDGISFESFKVTVYSLLYSADSISNSDKCVDMCASMFFSTTSRGEQAQNRDNVHNNSNFLIIKCFLP